MKIISFIVFMLVASSAVMASPNTPSDLCVTSATTTCPGAVVPPPPSGDLVKWHPGHYTLERPYKAYGHPEILGSVVSYNWRDLEPSQGVYDFSQIASDLAEMKANGKRMFVNFRYKTFNTQAKNLGCAPQYIIDGGGVAFVYKDDGTLWKCLARIWQPTVSDAIIALVAAMGAQFNDDPYFEGFSTGETAGSGQDIPSGDGYTTAGYVNAFKHMNEQFKLAFPNTLVVLQANFIDGGDPNMLEIFQHAEQYGTGIGGPDLMPNRTTQAYPLYTTYKGKIPLLIDNQRAPTVAVDPTTAFAFAVDDTDGLHCNYVFWATVHTDPPWRFDEDILPVIQGNNARINSDCPTNIQCNTN